MIQQNTLNNFEHFLPVSLFEKKGFFFLSKYYKPVFVFKEIFLAQKPFQGDILKSVI